MAFIVMRKQHSEILTLVRYQKNVERCMNIDYVSPFTESPGAIVSLLQQAYAELVKSDVRLWEPEQPKWAQYDKEVYEQPETVGACLFLTRLDGHIVGFASWDPRQGPRFGIIGHNCILPAYRGRGLGKMQIREVLRRFQERKFANARVSTNDHPFFLPAQRMYTACGFREIRRIPWERDPQQKIIEYESVLDYGECL